MEGFERHIARDLFEAADVAARRSYAAEKGLSLDSPEVAKIIADDGFVFEVTFLELLGKTAVDLVEVPSEFDAEGNPVRKEVPVREDKVCDRAFGRMHPCLTASLVGRQCQPEAHFDCDHQL